MENQETSPTAGASSGTIPEATVARKPCPSCGEMIAETAKKCRFCGKVLDASIAPPNGVANATTTGKPTLYNPNVAGILSVFFSPIFGSWCVKRNYEALGLSDKARRSNLWMIISIVYVLLSMVVPGLAMGWLVFLIVWYFCENKKQTQYLKENNVAYEKKRWLKPVLIAIGLQIVALVLLVLIAGGIGKMFGGGNFKKVLENESVSLVNQIVENNYGARAPKCIGVVITSQKNDSTYTGIAMFDNHKTLKIFIEYYKKTDRIEVTIPNQ